MANTMPRRDFLGTVAIGAGAVVVGVSANVQPAQAKRRKKNNPKQPNKPESSATEQKRLSAAEQKRLTALKQLVAPMDVGAKLGEFTIMAIEVSRHNTGVITLKTVQGQTVDVDLCRRDGEQYGISTSRYYSLYLRNGGDGTTPTNEQLGVAVMHLGAIVRRNERAVARIKLASKKEFWATVS